MTYLRRLAAAAAAALSITAVALPVLGGAAWAAGVKRIFIVQSQEKGHVCGEPQAEGILEALAGEGWKVGSNLVVEFHHLDYYGKNAAPEALHAEGQKALRRIEDFRPDLVFTLDDGAIKEVMMPLVGRQGIDVVFSGMNAQPETYNARKKFMDSWAKPGANVTGVYEKLYAAESLRVMAQAVPDLLGGKALLITDRTVTGDALTAQFERELKERRRRAVGGEAHQQVGRLQIPPDCNKR